RRRGVVRKTAHQMRRMRPRAAPLAEVVLVERLVSRGPERAHRLRIVREERVEVRDGDAHRRIVLGERGAVLLRDHVVVRAGVASFPAMASGGFPSASVTLTGMPSATMRCAAARSPRRTASWYLYIASNDVFRRDGPSCGRMNASDTMKFTPIAIAVAAMNC